MTGAGGGLTLRKHPRVERARRAATAPSAVHPPVRATHDETTGVGARVDRQQAKVVRVPVVD